MATNSSYSISVAWLLSLTTALISAGLLGLGVLLLLPGIVLLKWELATEAFALLGIGYMTLRRSITEFRDACGMTWPHGDAVASE